MVSGACHQAADVGADVSVGVPGLNLHGSSRSVAGRGSVLEVNGGG